MLSCKHGCGYETSHKGAMNLHENIHCPTVRNNSKSGGSAPAPKKKKGCEHTFRILTAKEERFLRSKGQTQYDEVCSRCGELQ